jgi:hypothetical protein
MISIYSIINIKNTLRHSAYNHISHLFIYLYIKGKKLYCIQIIVMDLSIFLFKSKIIRYGDCTLHIENRVIPVDKHNLEQTRLTNNIQKAQNKFLTNSISFLA